MQISAISNYSYRVNTRNNNQNFNGLWIKTRAYASYPHENTMVDVMKYVPDANEPIPEIQRNFAQKSGHSNIFYAHDIYTAGGTNFLVDGSKSLEMRKVILTDLTNEALKKGDYIAAAEHKLEIARILQQQQKERDKFLTELGLREIYDDANTLQKITILELIKQYNEDMAADL